MDRADAELVDIRTGLYILRYPGPRAADIANLRFLEGNSDLADTVRLDRSAGTPS